LLPAAAQPEERIKNQNIIMSDCLAVVLVASDRELPRANPAVTKVFVKFLAKGSS
jgi:hypothetical protein